MAANIHVHPAPNRMLGELMQGWYDVPQNPITAAQMGVAYTPTLGDIMAGSFVVPQNPLKAMASGFVQPIGTVPGVPGTVNGKTVGKGGGTGDCGCGGGGGGGGCSCGGHGSGTGMGDIGSDLTQFWTDLSSGNLTQALTVDTIAGFPSWAVLGVVGVGLLWVFGGTGESRARKAYKYTRRKASALATA